MASLLSLLILCGLLLAAFGLGRPVVRVLGWGRAVGQVADLPPAVAVWSVAVGLVAGSVVILVLGSIGLLCVPAIVLLTAAGVLAGLGELLYDYVKHASEKALAPPLRHKTRGNPRLPVPSPPNRWLVRGAWAAAGAACLASLLTALAPPFDGDAFRRLEPAKRCLIEHDLSAFADSQAGSPNLTDAWHIWALALDGGVCAQLVDWSIVPLLALVAVALAAPLVGRPWAWIAGTLVAIAAAGVHPASQPPQGLLGGLLLLAALPGVLLARRLRGLGILLTVAIGYAFLGLLFRADPWLMLPAVPLLAVAATWVWIELRRFPPAARWVAQIGLVSLAVAAAAVAINVPRDRLAVAVGLEDRDDYLVRHAPTYPAAAVANAILKNDAHLLSEDDCTFHFNCRVTRCSDFRRATADEPPANPSQRCGQLRAAGFTHLLLVDSDPADLLAPDSLLTLTEYRYVADDGAARHYRLVMLR
jgi:hypothetical protein